MEYISIGAVLKPSTEQILQVSHCGQDFQLTGVQAALWLNGRFGFAKADNPVSVKNLHQLDRMNLVVPVEGIANGRYWALTACVICPAAKKRSLVRMSQEEKAMLCWLSGAGLRLSVAELVYLAEHDIAPSPGLLGEENRQALVETIYTKDTIMDNLLEHQMEKAGACSRTVETIQKLLAKKQILLL